MMTYLEGEGVRMDESSKLRFGFRPCLRGPLSQLKIENFFIFGFCALYTLRVVLCPLDIFEESIYRYKKPKILKR